MITLLIFLFFGALAVVSAILVILQRNAMHSVLYLAFNVLAVSGVFFCFQAEYLGAIQILVYGGGIVVLYVFVIVIVNLKEIVPEKRKLFPKIFIVAMPALLLAEIATVVVRGAPAAAAGRGPGLDLAALAETLMTDYLVPFELASILLLAVLVGAVIIARRRYLHDPR
ncbi:MAG: NADH-quinone oxidoreductase subunit J [Candidatus Aminicenantales bacterium]|jgi:NADH-quinone oxidoreductase subunit J